MFMLQSNRTLVRAYRTNGATSESISAIHASRVFSSIVPSRHRVVTKNKLQDDLLDYVTAGPKMRKWYGQGQRLPRDGGEDPSPNKEDENEEENSAGDTVLVMDAESANGEQVVLQLILARANIKVLVKDVEATKTAYGPYVKPVSVDESNRQIMLKVLKNVGSVVVLGKPGALLQVAKQAGVKHIVMLSAAGLPSQGGFLGSLFNSEMGVLRDASREAHLRSAGVPYTIVRAAAIRDAPGGSAAISFSQSQAGSQATGAAITREDLAVVLTEALQRPPATGREFQVLSTGSGEPPEDWEPLFGNLSDAMAGQTAAA